MLEVRKSIIPSRNLNVGSPRWKIERNGGNVCGRNSETRNVKLTGIKPWFYNREVQFMQFMEEVLVGNDR